MNSVYAINKGVNRPIVFRGLQGQYIWWLGGGVLGLLLLFALCYIAGLPILFCIILVGTGGFTLFYCVYRLNRIYGEHGWMKAQAKRMLPRVIKCDQLF